MPSLNVLRCDIANAITGGVRNLANASIIPLNIGTPIAGDGLRPCVSSGFAAKSLMICSSILRKLFKSASDATSGSIFSPFEIES